MEKVVIVGAGSAYFTRKLIVDLMGRDEPLELGLVDIDETAVEMAARLGRKMVDLKHAPLAITASTDRRQLLPGATAVISTIAVGGRRAWDLDVQIPRRYGIFHPGGDTTMPAGTSRSLRVIPPSLEIARDVLELAPQALYFNYSNPMAVVCRAIRRETGADVIGLCTGVPEVADGLARSLEVDSSRMKYNAIGINHCTWFTGVRAEGEDAFPRMRELALSRLAEAERLAATIDDSAEKEELRRQLRRLQPFCWQMFLLTGAFPSPNDGHVVEFYPHLFRGERSYFGMTLGLWSEQHRAKEDQRYAQMQEDAFSDKPLPDDYCERVPGAREHAIDILYSVRSDDGAVYSANLPNRGRIADLPEESVLEGPVIATAAGLRPIAQRPLPTAVLGQLASRFQWVEAVIEAAVEGNREKVVQALILDGAVDSYETAQELTDELLAAHFEHLPQFRPVAGRKPEGETEG
jgi:alpha-galactosidase